LDTEAGVYLTSRNRIVELCHRLKAHLLSAGAGPEASDDTTAVREWTSIARRNAALPRGRRLGFLSPQGFAAAEALDRRLPILPEEFA